MPGFCKITAAAGGAAKVQVVLFAGMGFNFPMLGLPKGLWVFIFSAAPLLELRASIPFALLTAPAMAPLPALVLSVLGSWLPAFFVVFVLEHIEPLLRRLKILNYLLDKIYAKTRAKSAQIEKLEFWGLALFVGIPLPGTGVWTGSLAGYLLGLPKAKIILAALLGTIIAGLLMTAIIVLGLSGWDWLF